MMQTVALWLLVLTCAAAAAAPAPAPAQRCAPPCPPADRCVFRILAVGDSLTRGAVPSTSSSHPYSTRMSEVLRKLQNRATVQVTTAGYDYMGTIQKAKDANGRQLDLTLVPYTQQLLQQARSAGHSYQLAVVLAGINDLGAGNHSAAAVFPRLVQIYDMLLASGATVVAVPPWPNRFVSRSSDNERQRQLLMQRMKQYVASASNNARSPRVHLLELPPQSFDFWTMPANRISQMQDDLLHLTPYGYDLFGQLVAERILSVIKPTECLCTCSSSSSSSSSGRPSGGSTSSRGLGQFLANMRLPLGTATTTP